MIKLIKIRDQGRYKFILREVHLASLVAIQSFKYMYVNKNHLKFMSWLFFIFRGILLVGILPRGILLGGIFLWRHFAGRAFSVEGF